MLVCATNPCSCGAGAGAACRCSARDLERHARRLSGPLLDRIDMRLRIAAPTLGTARSAATMSTAEARAEVARARERQRSRLAGSSATVNAEMDAATVAGRVRLDTAGERLLRDAVARGSLSPRGTHRVMKVA